MKSLDIFCEIIDNYGDIGVVYRLAKEMKKLYKDNIEIRVILNRLDEFKKLNKRVEDIQCQEIDGIIYITEEFLTKNICTFSPANVIIEAFGCNVFQGYLEKAKEESSLLLNLEYLSGEKWIEDIHGMESLMGAKKLKKFFFMPGFSEKSGGVMADSLFLERKHKVLKNKTEYKEKYFGNYYKENMLVGSIFSYEKNFLPLIEALLKNKKENMLLVMGEKTKESFQNLLKNIEVQKLSEDEYVYENI
ncbi:elongation factor P maturation arginine rhamnosyltransferase EarP, partial [uncultured Cetobacterium sp.]